MDAWSGSMCHLSAGTEILNGGRRNVLLAIQYWLFRADQPALTQFTWISCYIGRALRSFNNERLVDRVGSDVGREKTRESFIRSVNGEWGCCEFHPLNVRETPWRMDEEAMWKDFYHKIVVEKEEKQKEQQESTEHEIR